jgi:hypothetical protein
MVNLGNSATEDSRITVQAGAFGEHTIQSAHVIVDNEIVATHVIGGPWFEIVVPAKSLVTLRLEMSRHSRTPSYETPFQSAEEWDPLIKPRVF